MYKISELKKLLPFDIETLPEAWETLTEEKQHVWKEKYHYRFFQQEIENRKKKIALEKDVEDASTIPVPTPTFLEIYIKYAGLFPEFARIWCISFGAWNLKNELEINTLQDDDEKEVINGFIKVLTHYDGFELAGYNINDFDIPFIISRMQINGISQYPRQLRLKDAKPWTVKHVDFMNDWKTTRRESVSLSVVCAALGVKTPKDKFNNDEFTTLMTNGLITVADGIEYCEKDVKALGECMWKCASTDCNFGGEEVKKTWTKK